MDIKRIASLARLKLTEEEEQEFSSQLDSILKYIDKLKELDTLNVEPTAHILPLRNILREDKMTDSLTKENALRNAPDRTNDFYRVPKIIE